MSPEAHRRRRGPPADDRPVSVGRIVHYWTTEGAQLVENAALVVRVVDLEAGKCWLHVFWAGAFQGDHRVLCERSPTPLDGRWTWPRIV